MCLLPGGWLVFDVRPPQRISQFGTHQQVDQDRGEFSDGSTIVATGQWEHRDGGRVIRKVVNLERLHQGMRQGTEVFDYRERLYDQDELIIMLQAAGFHTIHVTKAYHHDQHPEPTDGFVVSCQRT
jgi:hypothetical protein